jgi:glycerol-3-phosphate acyltransferase PlsY
MYSILLVIIAYLLGSLSSSLIIGKLFFNIDIREHGSGNAGATNAMRVLGKKQGLLVFLFDVLKGFLAANLIFISKYYIIGTEAAVNFQVLLGLAVVFGHIFPVFFNFKGGKGVATLMGVILAIMPFTTLFLLGVFVLTLFATKYVSVSSMTAGLSLPFLSLFVFKETNLNIIMFGFVAFVLLVVTHQKNIERLIRGEENKIAFGKKDSE